MWERFINAKQLSMEGKIRNHPTIITGTTDQNPTITDHARSASFRWSNAHHGVFFLFH